MRPKSRRPSLLVDGDELASETSTCTYPGTCLLKHWAERSLLDGSRGLERQLCQVSRARRLAMMTAMAIQMEVTETVVMETARLVAMALTRRESKQCGWLKKVSICTGVEGNEPSTHQCRLSHPSNPQTICMEPLGLGVDMEGSKSSLQKSAKR